MIREAQKRKPPKDRKPDVGTNQRLPRNTRKKKTAKASERILVYNPSTGQLVRAELRLLKDVPCKVESQENLIALYRAMGFDTLYIVGSVGLEIDSDQMTVELPRGVIEKRVKAS